MTTHASNILSSPLLVSVTQRVPELFYQPSMIGLDQCGLAEALQLVLQYYAPDVQQRMVQVRE